DDFAYCRIVRDGQINRVGERDGRSSPPFGAVATRAVLGVQSAKFQDLIRRQCLGTCSGLAVRRSAAREEHRAERRECTKMSKRVQGYFSPLPRGGMIPGASIPARMAKGRFSLVRTRDWRITTSPATMPKANCQAMNQTQSM